MSNTQKRISRIAVATDNMAILVDSVIKDALKNYRKSGEINLDTKLLKESVSVLRDLWGLIEDAEQPLNVDEGVVIRLEGQLQQFSK